MLEIKSLYKRFDTKKIIHNLDLTIDKAQRCTIIGPSGSGKSTILKLIVGILKPDKGQILIDGTDITTLNINDLNEVRRHVGLLFQSAALFDSMTVFENIAFPLVEQKNLMTPYRIKQKVRSVLEMVEMVGHEDKFPEELSGGQRKRIGLARVLVTDPSFILYDEPTTGMDPILSTNIENLINKLSQELNVTSIIVTHQLSTIFRTSDQIHYLSNGALLDSESPALIRESKNDIIRNFIKGGLS